MIPKRSGKKKDRQGRAVGAGSTERPALDQSGDKSPRAKHPPAPSAAREEPARPSPAGPLVLIVDDYEDAREMCGELLRFYGFRVELACNGYEAVEKAFSLIRDLVLMDLSLPGMDGWEATRRIKADPRTRSIPVLALTGHALEGHEERAREAGCDAFITKPVMPDDLIKEVRRMVALDGKPKLKVN
jgi:two-component system cell cycle response regulator DivK